MLAALAVLSSWSIGALFFSLGPQLAANLFDTTNTIADGSGIVLLAAAAAGRAVPDEQDPGVDRGRARDRSRLQPAWP